MPKSRKSGPYPKQDKEKRRNEVYRLHFEYGYSARKIAELMKINRNTVNGDIDYWYSKIIKNNNIFNPEYAIIVNLQRLEIQRSRLREQLDETGPFQEKLALERLMCDIDSKILHTFQKLSESSYGVHKHATTWLNDNLKKRKIDERYLTFYDTISVSRKAKERIQSIINKDREKRNSN